MVRMMFICPKTPYYIYFYKIWNTSGKYDKPKTLKNKVGTYMKFYTKYSTNNNNLK